MSWFGADDERWQPVMNAAWAHIPAERQRPDYRAGDSPWRDVASLEAAVRDAEYGKVTTTEETHVIRFPTADHFWRWTRSHGMLGRWEAMPADRHAQARADAEAVMDGVREPDGSLTMQTQVRYTVAHLGRDQ